SYSQQVVDNARTLAAELQNGGLDIVTGGTDTHLLLVDLRPKGVTGKAAQESLENAGITCNKNAVPFDPEKPTITSGVRLGTPAGTTRGFGEEEFRRVAELIVQVLDGLAANPEDNSSTEQTVREEVRTLCRRFPVYPDL
ncbi:MAG: serine hydroxymethyltransferase, partial [Rhodovibrionaceae bacterium]|nr:serine hydroxymethyltransferase [Rhodovibrionaceae bacterium]